MVYMPLNKETKPIENGKVSASYMAFIGQKKKICFRHDRCVCRRLAGMLFQVKILSWRSCIVWNFPCHSLHLNIFNGVSVRWTCWLVQKNLILHEKVLCLAGVMDCSIVLLKDPVIASQGPFINKDALSPT